MGDPRHLPLPLLLAHSLQTLLPVFNDEEPLSHASSQAKLGNVLDNLYTVNRMVTSLGLFSDNEEVEELGDGELVFMAVGWVIGEVEGKMGLSGHTERIACISRSITAHDAFLQLLSSYGVLSPNDVALSATISTGAESLAPRDPASRRDAKIRQYRREKELREEISIALPGSHDPSSSPLAFLLALLPSDSTPSKPEYQASTPSVNPDIEFKQREVTLLVLRLLYTSAITSIAHGAMELEILSAAPHDIGASSSSSSSAPPRTSDEVDNTWRLDRSSTQHRPKELISGGGKVLRPFTILPSISHLSNRERLKEEVFRNGHRLPTMTIDEYLDEEKRRGNIITGGGQASADAPTASEILALDAQNDGTMRGDEAAEERRLKDEYWAQYGELNKKGAGNTTNRG